MQYKMLKAKLIVSYDAEILEKIFFMEDKEFSNDRASYKVFLKGKVLEFDVEAKDSVAMRSVMNTITKILTVYEKTKEAIKDE